ncbi:hypothetical protein QQY66_47350 [Streptomyces sp. DG2A-72]|uniref:hypothetical protein n=1 Tax=Streptomyces sp. DG2A-72 TaxID=3051386 RepID=UPI00265C6053|nr:hypothetical protein [Streptomyces sp. DG2A-72]MDO0938967.1 hypothetical protein [Streptomyces sp. DG2A-72]
MLAGKGCALDGPVPQPVRSVGLDRPVMLVRSERPEIAPSVDAACKWFRPRGFHRDLQLT